MEWIKGMRLIDYAADLIEESSRQHGYRNRITMSKAMAEARFAWGFYRIEMALGMEAIVHRGPGPWHEPGDGHTWYVARQLKRDYVLACRCGAGGKGIDLYGKRITSIKYALESEV